MRSAKPRFRALALLFAASLTAPAQFLHNAKRDQQAQEALKLSQEIASGAVFDKMLKNLAEVARLDEKATLETAQFNLRTELDGLKTWNHVAALVKSVEQELGFEQPATKEELNREIGALREEMASAKEAAAELKKKLTEDSLTHRLGAIGLWLERVGKAEPVYGYLDRFLRDQEASQARLKTAKEMGGLLRELGKLYRDFKVSVPASPSLLWLQTRLELLRLEEQSFEQRIQIRERRERETKPIQSLLTQAKVNLAKLNPKYEMMDISASLDEQGKLAAVNTSEREALERMVATLYNAAALAARGATPAKLSSLRQTKEERALSIRQMATRARLYEALVGSGVERLALFHKGGRQPATIAQILQAMATLGLIPAIAFQ